MAKYLTKRVLQSFITILLIICIVFLLLRLMPADYFFTEQELMKLTKEQRMDRLQAEGLLDPPLVQLGRFLGGLARGDFGVSRRLQAGQPVVEVISEKFMVSIQLGAISFALSLVLGIVIGILQARFKDRLLDNIGMGFTVLVQAVPHLVLYSLILVFGSRLFGLPSMYSTRKVFMSSILPVVCLSVGSIASYMLWTRRYMVDELNKDYIRLAKLKGLSTRTIMFRHVLRNAMVPLVQYMPYSFLMTIGGSLLAERFFSVPGMGPLLTDSISRYDVNVVQALVILYAVMGILGLLLGDLLMTAIDPRIRISGKGGTTR